MKFLDNWDRRFLLLEGGSKLFQGLCLMSDREPQAWSAELPARIVVLAQRRMKTTTIVILLQIC